MLLAAVGRHCGSCGNWLSAITGTARLQRACGMRRGKALESGLNKLLRDLKLSEDGPMMHCGALSTSGAVATANGALCTAGRGWSSPETVRKVASALRPSVRPPGLERRAPATGELFSRRRAAGGSPIARLPLPSLRSFVRNSSRAWRLQRRRWAAKASERP